MGGDTECNLDVWMGPKGVTVECGWSQNIIVEVSVGGVTECKLDVWVGPKGVMVMCGWRLRVSQ